MPRGYQFPDATSIDHPVRPVVRQGAAKLLPLIDHPGGGAAIGEAVGLAGVVPHLVDVPGNLSIGPGQGPRDNIASVQTAEELDYAQFRRDERTRIANCSGTIGNGNCTSYAGGVFYDTPNGDWWNTPYAYIGNPYGFNANCSYSYSPNSTWSLNGGQIGTAFAFSEDRDDTAVWNSNWNNCNCGDNNCVANCNCNCACTDCSSCP